MSSSLAHQFVQFPALVQCHQVRIAPNMFAIDKDVGDGLLTRHLEQFLLDSRTILYQTNKMDQSIQHSPSTSNSTM